MLNLKLFTYLQGSNSASLLLRPSDPGMVRYFIMASTVNYSIVVSGQCEGEIANDAPMSFDVVLSSIVPLLDKNNKFRLSYVGGKLCFIEEHEKYTVTPLCVEHVSDTAIDIAQRYLDTTAELERSVELTATRSKLEEELTYYENNYNHLRLLAGYGGPPANPWGEPGDTVTEEDVDNKYLPKIEDLKKQIRELDCSERVVEVDMQKMKRLASIAARYGTVISMCGDYAIVSLNSCYILQKVDCGVRAMQGKMLQRLLQEDSGQFFDIGGQLVFRCVTGKGDAASDTMIFIQQYLPNVSVGKSIVTKGAVLEKYQISLKGMLPVISAVSSKFDKMVFEMGSSCLTMSNDRGETLVHKFDVEDAKTLELNKAMRGEYSGAIVMSDISVPVEVQRILGSLKEDFTIFIKDRKIVLQSGDLYVVFAR